LLWAGLIVEQHKGWLKSIADLPEDFNAKGRMIVAHSGNLGDLNIDLERIGPLAGTRFATVKPYRSWSEVAFALAAIFKANGRFTSEQIAAALPVDLECNQHITKIDDEAKKAKWLAEHLAGSKDGDQDATFF